MNIFSQRFARASFYVTALSVVLLPFLLPAGSPTQGFLLAVFEWSSFLSRVHHDAEARLGSGSFANAEGPRRCY